MTNPNTCINCGASGQNWDGEGRCISCARDEVLGTNTPEFETVGDILTKLDTGDYLGEGGVDAAKKHLKQSMRLMMEEVR